MTTESLTNPVDFMNRKKQHWVILCSLFSWLLVYSNQWIAPIAFGQPSELKPRICRPGESTRLALIGKGLDRMLRVLTSRGEATVQVLEQAADQAAVEVTLPASAPLGSMAIWIADESAVSEPWVVMVDDMPAVERVEDNTSRQAAQWITPPAAISGVSRGAKGDFYRFYAEAGQQISFEILTQSLHSPMDPLLKLMTLDGHLLAMADDDGVGPESRFCYRFEQPGEYLLEVLDSRYAAGGNYHLRIGDFPILQSVFPAVVQLGQAVDLEFAVAECINDGPGNLRTEHLAGATADTLRLKQQIQIHSDYADPTTVVSIKKTGGQSSAWRQICVTELPVLTYQTEPLSLPTPSCYCGQLLQDNQTDRFKIIGTKDQTIMVNSRTRSFGSPCLLKLQLINAEGHQVAETKPEKEDEWNLEYQFPDDAEYTLQASDLLGRGGSEYIYAIELRHKRSFSLAVKGDANSTQRFMVDARRGCVAVDLLVKRDGYEGEIELSLRDTALAPPIADIHASLEPKFDSKPGLQGLSLLAATIPAGASEHRVYLVANERWSQDLFSRVRLQGRATTPIDNQHNAKSCVSYLKIARQQRPYLPYPEHWSLGSILLAGKASSEALFALDDTQPLQLARHVLRQPARLELKRLHPEYQGTPTILPFELPSGWSVSFQADKGVYNATLSWEDSGAAEMQNDLQLLVYGEHKGQGFLERSNQSIQWVDPVRLSFQMPQKLVSGSAVPISVRAKRMGPPAEISLQWPTLPDGVQITGPLVIAADQDSISAEIHIGPDTAPGPIQLQCQVTSKFHDQEYTFSASTPTFQLLTAPTRLEVYPEIVELSSQRDKRQMIVTGYDATGKPSDWTNLAEYLPEAPDQLRVHEGVATPLTDGKSFLTVKVGNVQQQVPVRITNSQNSPRIDFESEVLVALSKQGCNSGACHGSPSGKGMFRLSLRAFDPPLDELTLIREEFGRRLNTVEPEQSLLLLKPLMKVAHGGGKQIRREDVAYRILVDWIRQGGKADLTNAPRCESLLVTPSAKRTLKILGTQQLSVLACFSDGSKRDVTELAAYESSDQQVASVDVSGKITALSHGEAVILVRFLEHIKSVPIACLNFDPEFRWQAPATNNFVDELVHEKLRSMQYLPSETCSDSEFLRRSYLDLIGILPTVDETRSFLGDSNPDKRARLVDSLLERGEYAKFWALKWGDLLKLTSKLVGGEAVHKYHRWIEQAIASDMPYDQFARELVTASGSTLANPPANFYRTSTDVNECVETISQVFLGARLQCAKCHNHPFERWTQDNYYGLAAFFSRVTRKETTRPGEMFIWAGDSGEVIQPRTGQQMKPWLPMTGSVDPPAEIDRRQIFADWLTEPQNPFLAKMGVNRIWSHLFARGIIDPVDDFRDSNPASNEALLEALANEFRQHNFSTKHLLRIIMNSRTYQASSQAKPENQRDTRYFSHQYPRMLKAEQLLDAVNHLTGVTQSFGSLPSDWKATQLPAPDLVKVDFLKVFGQPERSTVCACERSGDSNLAMAIELLNGPLIHERLRDPNNRFRKGLAAGMSDEAILEELYLAGLCRLPSTAEREAAMAHIKQREDTASALEDVCWAMLNTDEFLFQH